MDEEVNEELDEIKDDFDLREIAIFDNKGQMIVTTQADNFRADETIYSVLSGAVKVISKGYSQESEGVTIELQSAEFFLHHDFDDGTITALEYDPQSLDRDTRKTAAKKVAELF